MVQAKEFDGQVAGSRLVSEAEKVVKLQAILGWDRVIGKREERERREVKRFLE